MKKLAHFCVIAGLSSIATTPAYATETCDLSIRTVGETRLDNYNALRREAQPEPIRILVKNNGRNDCRGTVFFRRNLGDGLLTGPRNAKLDYQIVGQQSINNVLFDPSLARPVTIPIRLRGGQNQEFRPRLLVQPGQEGVSGTYRSTIDAVFTPAGSNDETVTTVRLAARVIPVVQANFVGVSRSSGNGGASLVNLGEIEPGMRRSLGIQLRSNTDVDVSISSEHHGKLVRRGRGRGSIGYQIDIAGASVDLTAQDSIVLPTSVRRNGLTSRIVIQIDDFKDAPAGRYADTILFRISAR